MSTLKERIQSVSKSETVHLDCFDCDVEIFKITLKDAKKLDKLKNDPYGSVLYILSNFIYADGEPLASSDEKETVGGLTAGMLQEIADKFRKVNEIDEVDVKKKVSN